MSHVGRFPCPQGCGNNMEFADEAQKGACRFCQTRFGMGGIQHGQTVGGSAGFPMPNQVAPGYQAPGGLQAQPQQPGMPPHVQVVGQKSPEEINAMRVAAGLPPHPLPSRQMPQAAPQQPAHLYQAAPQAQAPQVHLSYDMGAIDSDLQRLMVEMQSNLASFLDTVSRMAVAMQAKYQALQANGTQAQEMPDLQPVAKPQAVVPNGPIAKRTNCNTCNVESLGGVTVDYSVMPHTCEKAQSQQGKQ